MRQWADSPAEAAAGADAVFVMVSDDDAARTVCGKEVPAASSPATCGAEFAARWKISTLSTNSG